MLDSYDIDRLKHIANTDVVRRLLIKYFIAKGFGNTFNRHLYPPLLQDLPNVIPILATKIELVPYLEEVDLALDRAMIGWNLYVLGSHRMSLGVTHHNNLRDLARQIKSGLITGDPTNLASARQLTTPKKVIMFIVKVLSSNSSGFIDLRQPSSIRKIEEPYVARQSLAGMPQQFYQRPY